MQDKILRIEEAARLVHVSPETIKYWVKTGRLATLDGPLSARSGRPRGKRVRKEDVLSAAPLTRTQKLKEEFSDLNLLTVPELCRTLQRQPHWVYGIIRKFQLKRYYVDGTTYMLSGVELYEKAADDPYYAQLFLHL